MTAYQNNILLQQYNNMIANLNRQNVAVNNSTQSNDYENLQKLIEKDVREENKIISFYEYTLYMTNINIK